MRLGSKLSSFLQEFQRIEEPPSILPFISPEVLRPEQETFMSELERMSVEDPFEPDDPAEFLAGLGDGLLGESPLFSEEEPDLDDADFLAELSRCDDEDLRLEAARQMAAEDAVQMEKHRQRLEVEKSMKRGKCPSLDPLREKIEMAKKPRCRTIEQYLCDRCDGVIAQAQDGFVIEGNIYNADPTSPGGLIGNNFPEPEEGKTEIPIDRIKKTVLCKRCLLNSLGLGAPPPKPNNEMTPSRIARKAKRIREEREARLSREVTDATIPLWLSENEDEDDWLVAGEGM